MASIWQVKALRTAMFTIDKSQFTPGVDIGKIIEIPVLMVAAWNETARVLIDTGIHSEKWINDNTNPCKQNPEEQFESVLKTQLGWTPADVDIVINTHLHYDHCGNNRLCTNAEFVIQRREWDSAWAPVSRMAIFYLQELFDSGAMNYFDICLVDGEKEILPGLQVFPTTGHSYGHQSALINTAAGSLCVTGDICNLTVSFYDQTPSGITTDFNDVERSFLEIKKRSAYFIPSHDPVISMGQTDNFPPARRK